jgi:hypothetical protein
LLSRAVVLALILAAVSAGTALATPKAKQRLETRQQTLRQQLNTTQQDAFALLDERDAAQDAYERALNLYSDHIVELYEKGDTSRVALIASARDISGAIDRAIILKRLADYDREVLEEYRVAAERVAGSEAKYDAALTDLGSVQSELDNVNVELASFEEPAQVVDLDNGVRTKQQSNGPLAIENGQVSQGEAPPPTADHFFTTTPLPGFFAPNLNGGFGSFPNTPSTPPVEMPDGYQATGQIETGVASWYGPGFNGHTTANGETYDMYAMTAAHKTLPFGTWVKVTATTGRSTFVRINDRGPYIDGRIIDLSYTAAQAIGMDGVANVQIEIWAMPGTTSAP